ncbi:MAG: MucB/RseB C-terminal domain-containing protein [Pseudomonadales bacterium]
MPAGLPVAAFRIVHAKWAIGLCFCAVCYSLQAQASTPEQWLMEMSANASRLSYSGSLVYAEGRRMRSMHMYHAVKNGVQRERLVHLSGEPREVVRRGDTVLCIDKANGEVALKSANSAAMSGDSAFSSSFAARFAALSEPYTVSFAGEGRVAGRPVTLIDLLPRDEYRHGFRLALDSESKLLLRSLMVDRSGAVLERFEYTQIDIGADIADADLEPQLQVPDKRVGASERGDFAAAAGSGMSWRVGWVPPAFVRATQFENGAAVDALMFSDGLSAFSVFVDQQSTISQHSEQRGATMAHTVVQEDAAGRFSVTVVGEIPLMAARKIAASVSRKVPR